MHKSLNDSWEFRISLGTREQAYVYALSSAAVLHQVAKACVTGEIPYCPCGTMSERHASDNDQNFKVRSSKA